VIGFSSSGIGCPATRVLKRPRKNSRLGGKDVPQGLKRACENSRKGKKQQVPYATLCRKNISRNGPRNCRSLGFARDDKGEGGASNGERWPDRRRFLSPCRTERVFHHLGWADRPMIPPVGMTIRFRCQNFGVKINLSSRPERSEVEGPAVSFPSASFHTPSKGRRILHRLRHD